MKYGCTFTYTEMLYAHKIIEREDQLAQGVPLSAPVDYLHAYLPLADHTAFLNIHPTTISDIGDSSSRDTTTFYRTSPLVVQVCGNDPETLARACVKIAETRQCQAIDLNLGCPQQRAQENCFGSYLLDREHWQTVFACVKAMHTALQAYNIPLFCKIRFCPGGHEGTESYFQSTTDFCQGLFDSGSALIAVHGRTRGSPKVRRAGPADLVLVNRIAAALRARGYSQPVTVNGNIITREDAVSNRLEAPEVLGVMSAEGILIDPCVFAPRHEEGVKCPGRSELFREYCGLSRAYAAAGGWSAMDAYCAAAAAAATAAAGAGGEGAGESKQMSIARQHLSWML
jgi:tRNA-dihydrouridine synthase